MMEYYEYEDGYNDNDYRDDEEDFDDDFINYDRLCNEDDEYWDEIKQRNNDDGI